MALATANYFLKWLSRLIPIKRSDALTATLRNDSGSKESVNQQQRRELPLPLFINSSEMFIFSLWGLTPMFNLAALSALPAAHHGEMCDLSKRFLICPSSIGSYRSFALFINSLEMFIFSLWGLTPRSSSEQVGLIHAVLQHLLEAVLYSCNILMVGHTIPGVVGLQNFFGHLTLLQ